MLPDSKVSQLIGNQITGLSSAMQLYSGRDKVSKVIYSFADYTKRMIHLGRLDEVRRCFTMAAVLYHNGSMVVKNAIECVYVYTLSPLLHTRQQHVNMKELLPVTLLRLHRHHLRTSAL